ncbi:MAG: phosphoribosylformylglycinamidine cyclo-ligase [Bacteroidota bacterium]|nr:phosphoribosylformylglycinamidine cyclo-ligase [Bacteroidota bacterium]MDP4195761.1 phosphoribosylformylglycinamidine cyclo-ligase [Bacteroidota bacterium]
MEANYKAAGVDIQAGDETVKRIKNHVKSTFNKNVLMDIGHFGAFYDLNLPEYKHPVLVSSVDGVGTKLKIAFLMKSHTTVGQDLVNHCVNDIAVCGAKPLFFMDYLAFGKLYPDVAEKIIEGFSIACRQNGCALIGGETAEMPGLYSKDEYDMSGTIVGVVDKDRIIDGKTITKGDVLIGFESNGLHTNGYSLARNILLDKFSVNDRIEGFENSLGDELLRVHKSYLKLITELADNLKIKGFSHITGGGIIGNTKRIIPEGLKLKVDWNSWEMPAIFKLIQQTGNVSDEEMREVFNIGIGLIAVVAPNDVEKVLEIANSMKENARVIGKVE